MYRGKMLAGMAIAKSNDNNPPRAQLTSAMETTIEQITEVCNDTNFENIIDNCEIVFVDDVENNVNNYFNKSVTSDGSFSATNNSLSADINLEMPDTDENLETINIINNFGTENSTKYLDYEDLTIQSIRTIDTYNLSTNIINPNSSLQSIADYESEDTDSDSKSDKDFELDPNVYTDSESSADSSPEDLRTHSPSILDDQIPEPQLEPLQNIDTYISKPRSKKENKRLLNQRLRMEGKSFLGFRKPKDQKNSFQDKQRAERKIKPRCTCLRKSCKSITDDQRQSIFKLMWSKMSWDQRKIYVSNTVLVIATKRKVVNYSRRSLSLNYSLNVNNTVVQVCKKMYLNTTGLGEWYVKNAAQSSDHGIVENSKSVLESRAMPSTSTSDKTKVDFVKYFLENLIKLPSHYCRKTTSKLYLDHVFTSMADVFKAFEECTIKEKKPAANRTTFNKYFKEMNLAIFHPRKDRCDVCVKFEVGNLPEAEYLLHVNKKNMAQNEKIADKKDAENGSCHVICMDVQAAKLCPKTLAGSMYYKTKLTCHNFTVYNLKTKDATCFWFDETAADSQASTFASFLVQYLQSNFLDAGDKIPINIYSDGCTAQNRNCILSNALLYLSVKFNVEITQKFLEKGHTYMECDSVHSCIEKRINKRDVYLPSDYHRMTIEARPEQPYKVFEIVFI